MRKHRQLYGLMFRPSASSQKDYEKYIYSADYAVKKDFKKTYQDHIAAMEIVTMSSKIYILKNWKKVKDWSNLEISIIDNSGKETYYYNFNFKDKERYEKNKKYKSGSKFFHKAKNDLYKRKKATHNPVKKIAGVVLDTSDGDFSLDINGKSHLWIDDESVIILADYIEWKLNKNKKDARTTKR